ncbi:TPA: hypothetical protein ACP7R6_004695 [Escherichia coli]
MNNALLGPFITTALSGVSVYCMYYFNRWQTSLNQAQVVSRSMEDVLTNTAGLFNQKKAWLAKKTELSAFLTSLSQEMRRLDDLTIRLPLKCLQREQRHVLHHAELLQRYLDSHMADNQGEFFLLLHDVAMGSDYEVDAILTSLKTAKNIVPAAFRPIRKPAPESGATDPGRDTFISLCENARGQDVQEDNRHQDVPPEVSGSFPHPLNANLNKLY